MGKELYRVRKSWDDSKSQIGAFASLKKAISACEEAGEEYKVYSAKGTQMFPTEKEEPVEMVEVLELIEETKEPIMVEIEIPEEETNSSEIITAEPPVEEIVETEIIEEKIEAKPAVEKKILYRVRKMWRQPKTQLGSFYSLEQAIDCCKKYGEETYKVYDEQGEIVYPGTGITADDLDLKVGDKVIIHIGAKYPSGMAISDYIIKEPYYIINIKQNGIVYLSKKKQGEQFIYLNGLYLDKVEEVETVQVLEEKEAFKPYIIKVMEDNVSSKISPKNNARDKKPLIKYQLYTVMGEKDNWGLLRDDQGWVNLDFVKKIII